MTRRRLFALLALVALANGFLSPAVSVLWKTSVVWMPGFLLAVPGMVFFLTPLVLAALTLLVSGVPAALYERLAGVRADEERSLRIWLGGAVVLTLPAAVAVATALADPSHLR